MNKFSLKYFLTPAAMIDYINKIMN
jgi:hypothetical protein